MGEEDPKVMVITFVEEEDTEGQIEVANIMRNISEDTDATLECGYGFTDKDVFEKYKRQLDEEFPELEADEDPER